MLMLMAIFMLYFRANRKRSRGLSRSAFVLLLSTGFLVSPAIAAPQQGVYLGAGIGVSELEPPIKGGRYSLHDKTDQAGHVLLGYELDERWALELEYTDLGKATLKPNGTIAYRATSVSGLSRLWRGESRPISVFSRLGAGKFSNTSSLEIKKKRSFYWLFGVGIEAEISHNLDLRVDAVNYDKDTRRLSVSLLYNFSRGTIGKTDAEADIASSNNTNSHDTTEKIQSVANPV